MSVLARPMLDVDVGSPQVSQRKVGRFAVHTGVRHGAGRAPDGTTRGDCLGNTDPSGATLTLSPSVIASICSVKANRTASSIGHGCRNFGAGAVVLDAEECPSLENALLALRTPQQVDILWRPLLFCVESFG